VGILLTSTPAAFAADDTWLGTTDSTWATATNWAGGNVPGPGNTATFSEASLDVSGHTTLDLGTGVTLGALIFDSNAAAYTIGSGGAAGQTLTLDTVGNAITMNSGVANNELINANLALATTGTYTVTNNSTTNGLTLAGGISASTAGVKVLNVTGDGSTAISGAITAGSGAVNLLKLGTGTMTLSGGGAFGTAAIQTPYNGAASGGAAFSGVLLGGTTKISSGTYTSAGEFVVGGVLTNGGAGVNTNLTMDGGSLTGSNYLSLGRGNGVGAVSSDIVLNNSASITAANFSAGFNAANASNLPKGTFTLNNSSTFTISGNGVFNLAESAGSDMTMTLNGSSQLIASGTGAKTIGNFGTGVLTLNGTSSVTFGNAILHIGGVSNNNATAFTAASGTLNVNTGTTFTVSNEIRIGSGSNVDSTATGTVNVSGGTLNANALTLIRSNANVATHLTANLNVTNNGIVNVATGGTLVGWQGGGSTGTITLSSGAFNQGTTTASTNMDIGVNGNASGAVNVSGGTMTLQRNSNIRFATNVGNTGSNSLNISGGSLTFYSDAGSTVGGTGVIDLMNTAATGATNTINLNGGTLTANQIKASQAASGTRVINFNGGTLKSGSSSLAATFLASGVASTANVRNGGAIIDTNGNTVTIGQALVHSTVGGDLATDGGLTKNGTGTLTLSGANTYTGTTTVNAGTLATGSTGTFGAGNVTVLAGAALTFGNNTSIADLATLTFTNTSTINLSFSGTETLASVYDSVTATGLADGTYTASALNTAFNVSVFTGAGSFIVSAIPEPATYAALFGALALVGAAWNRRRRQA
jgi:autotransporter-associated beta strand protein